MERRKDGRKEGREGGKEGRKGREEKGGRKEQADKLISQSIQFVVDIHFILLVMSR